MSELFINISLIVCLVAIGFLGFKLVVKLGDMIDKHRRK